MESSLQYVMNYTTQEKLLALELLATARKCVPLYAQPQDHLAGVETVLRIAAAYASTGADFTVLKVLDYPDTEKAN